MLPILFERGSLLVTQRGDGCIEHVCLYAIPVRVDLRPALSAQVPIIPVDGLRDPLQPNPGFAYPYREFEEHRAIWASQRIRSLSRLPKADCGRARKTERVGMGTRTLGSIKSEPQ